MAVASFGVRFSFLPRSIAVCSRLYFLADVPLRPVLDAQTPEAGEVFLVCRRQHEPVHMGNRRNLTVDERSGSAKRFESRPLFPVPCRRGLIVWQDGERSLHDVTEIRFERGPALSLGQASTAIREFVPDWRRNRALRTALVQMFKNHAIGSFGDRGRNDAGVEEITERHRDTLRPVVLSRVETAKSSSTPISFTECRSRNRRYASLKCRRFPRRRSNSLRDTSTATGCPRRVSSTSIPDSASSTMLGRRDLASAMEYLRDIHTNVHHDVQNSNRCRSWHANGAVLASGSIAFARNS
jgi:hypothetical protein